MPIHKPSAVGESQHQSPNSWFPWQESPGWAHQRMMDKLGSSRGPLWRLPKMKLLRLPPNLFVGVIYSYKPGQLKAPHRGACGVDAMHAVQDLGKAELIYDGDTCRLGAIYGDDGLKVFAQLVQESLKPDPSIMFILLVRGTDIALLEVLGRDLSGFGNTTL